MAGFPEVEPLLEAFASGVEGVLADDLVGVYIHGSLALGGFDPRNSDVDFLVATRDVLEPDTVARLAALHRALGEQLDGSYVPRDVLRRFDPGRVMHPHIESRGGRLFVDHHGGETVIYRHVLRECGLVLCGPTPRELIDPIIVPKHEAAQWALTHLEVKWRDLISRAAAREDCSYEETVAFVRDTLAEPSCA